MSRQEQITQAVSDYLITNRYEPPARKGWSNGHEIWNSLNGPQGGFSDEVLIPEVVQAINTLMTAQPPRIQATWMTRQENGDPDLRQQYQASKKPYLAKRYYRLLNNSVEVNPNT